VYSVAIKTKAITRWTASETGGLSTDKFSNAKLLNWKSFDNLNISELLYRSQTNFPANDPSLSIFMADLKASQDHTFWDGVTTF
jgi:hypothetical protein